MKITIESTTKIVKLNGIHCRVWEGESENGIKVYAFISRVAIPFSADADQFIKELQECKPPSVEVQAIPLSLII